MKASYQDADRHTQGAVDPETGQRQRRRGGAGAERVDAGGDGGPRGRHVLEGGPGRTAAVARDEPAQPAVLRVPGPQRVHGRVRPYEPHVHVELRDTDGVLGEEGPGDVPVLVAAVRPFERQGEDQPLVRVARPGDVDVRFDHVPGTVPQARPVHDGPLGAAEIVLRVGEKPPRGPTGHLLTGPAEQLVRCP
ncbi:hypothetical protein [Streptomyces sp. NPDC051657]|uniref:hypothetical protein n=1 Tax=unclassified Streptomyces TaxID=2593676 RepID=UPI00341656D6